MLNNILLSAFCWLVHFVLPAAQALCEQILYVNLSGQQQRTIHGAMKENN
jgi:hypothetical protein